MGKKKYDIIFVTLCYRNEKDIVDFINSTKNIKCNFRIIVVNSYFNEDTRGKIERIAVGNDCDFIDVPNNGYGAGNNKGIDFAIKNYTFDFIVVCNADIEIINFDISKINEYDKHIIGPNITTLRGNRQNPMLIKRNKFGEFIKYHAFKNNILVPLYAIIAIEKVQRCLVNKIYKISSKNSFDVFAVHGSCIVFSKYSIDVLGLPFDEKMFLMCEENDLAIKAKNNNIGIRYCPELLVRHKEDGSISMAKINVNSILRTSYMYYYEKWNEDKKK